MRMTFLELEQRRPDYFLRTRARRILETCKTKKISKVYDRDDVSRSINDLLVPFDYPVWWEMPDFGGKTVGEFLREVERKAMKGAR